MQKSKTMFCGKCGTQLSDTDKFCPRCGEKVIPIIVENEKPSVNQEEVQKSENPTSLEQSKPLKDSNETVRPTIVSLQNTSDKQDNANINTQNFDLPGLESFDIQKISIASAFLFAVLIPILFVKNIWGVLIVAGVVSGLINVILSKFKIKVSNKIFFSIMVVAVLAGTVKYISTNNDTASEGSGASVKVDDDGRRYRLFSFTDTKGANYMLRINEDNSIELSKDGSSTIGHIDRLMELNLKNHYAIEKVAFPSCIKLLGQYYPNLCVSDDFKWIYSSFKDKCNVDPEVRLELHNE